MQCIPIASGAALSSTLTVMPVSTNSRMDRKHHRGHPLQALSTYRFYRMLHLSPHLPKSHEHPYRYLSFLGSNPWVAIVTSTQLGSLLDHVSADIFLDIFRQIETMRTRIKESRCSNIGTNLHFSPIRNIGACGNPRDRSSHPRA